MNVLCASKFCPPNAEAKLATAIAQVVKERGPLSYGDLKYDARILARQPVDDGEDDSLGNSGAGAQFHLSRRRVGKKLDILHSLFDLVEGRNAALEKSAAILGRFNTLRAALEQGHAKRMLCIGNGP